MVTTRSSGSIICDKALSSVVLPEPVPPEIKTLRRQREAIFSTVAIADDMLCWRAMMSSVIDRLANLRIEIEGPSMARGGAGEVGRAPTVERRAQTVARTAD